MFALLKLLRAEFPICQERPALSILLRKIDGKKVIRSCQKSAAALELQTQDHLKLILVNGFIEAIVTGKVLVNSLLFLCIMFFLHCYFFKTQAHTSILSKVLPIAHKYCLHFYKCNSLLQQFLHDCCSPQECFQCQSKKAAEILLESIFCHPWSIKRKSPHFSAF